MPADERIDKLPILAADAVDPGGKPHHPCNWRDGEMARMMGSPRGRGSTPAGERDITRSIVLRNLTEDQPVDLKKLSGSETARFPLS